MDPTQTFNTNENGLLSREQDASRILDLYGTSLLRLACSYVHTAADAQDLVQETLIQYLSTRPYFENRQAEKSWLMQVCANKAKNKARFNRLRRHASLEEITEKPAAGQEDLSWIWEAVCSLPSKYAGAVHLYYQEGYSTAQIAQILNIRQSSVRTRLARARTMLKSILDEEEI